MIGIYVPLAILALSWLCSALWMRVHYITEKWPADVGWRRLVDLDQHEPGRLWTVHRIHRRTGELTLIGLRRPIN